MNIFILGYNHFWNISAAYDCNTVGQGVWCKQPLNGQNIFPSISGKDILGI